MGTLQKETKSNTDTAQAINGKTVLTADSMHTLTSHPLLLVLAEQQDKQMWSESPTSNQELGRKMGNAFP